MEDEYEYETDPNAHNRVAPEDRGAGMDEPVHYTYAKPADKPKQRDVRVCDAVKAKDHDRVRRLVGEEGCSVHQRAEQDWTPLHFAAGQGDLVMVRLLVEELGADPTVVGRDRRRPSTIARGAGRDDVAVYLREREQQLGQRTVRDNHGSGGRPYCRAYFLKEMRRFADWAEGREAWKINSYWSDEARADFEKILEDDDVVFLHHDLRVTRGIWHDQHMIFGSESPQWAEFCKTRLEFEVPADLAE